MNPPPHPPPSPSFLRQKENGGVLEAKRHEYKQGRPNICISYPGSTDKVISLVGAHMDVVPAQAELWEFPPFQFKREDGKVFGRGTTDCLGHVALITELMCRVCFHHHCCNKKSYGVGFT